MLKISYISSIILVLIGLIGCNPNCEPISGLQVTPFNPVGFDIAITATPLSQLEDKTIYFGNVKAVDVKMESNFLRVKVPDGLNVGNTTLRIEDPDCQDVVQLNFSVVDPTVFKNNINFVPPVLPEIFIPNFTFNSFPSSINNAWVHPTEPDYCLWFTSKREKVSFPTVTDPTKFQYVNSLAGGSFELTTCCLTGNSGCEDASKLYTKNPIYGFYDTVANPRRLYFYIDRTAKKGGSIEEYEGVFLDPKTTKYENTKLSAASACGGDLPQPITKPLLLVTSKKTGRQTVVFRTTRFD